MKNKYKFKINKLRNKLNYLTNYIKKIKKKPKKIKEKKICRICYNENEQNNLINPCKCKGTMKWVHKKCLLKWLDISKKTNCQQCKYKFKLKETNNNYNFLHSKKCLNIMTILVYSVFLLITILINNSINNFFKKKYKIKINLNSIYNIIKLQICLFIIVIFFIQLIPFYKNIIYEILYENLYNLNLSYHPLVELICFFYNIIYKILKKFILHKFPIEKKIIIENYKHL